MTPMMKTVPLFLKGMCTCVCSDSLLSSMCVFWSCSNCVWVADGSGLGGCWRLLGSNLWRENINPPPTQGHRLTIQPCIAQLWGSLDIPGGWLQHHSLSQQPPVLDMASLTMGTPHPPTTQTHMQTHANSLSPSLVQWKVSQKMEVTSLKCHKTLA